MKKRGLKSLYCHCKADITGSNAKVLLINSSVSWHSVQRNIFTLKDNRDSMYSGINFRLKVFIGFISAKALLTLY